MIEIRNMTKRYGAFTAVDAISLEARPGEILGFLGPNGAGKTTTIRIIAGLSIPTEGTVRVAGFDVEKRPIEAKRRMGYVPDRPFLYEKLTGNELLQFVSDLYEVRWSDASLRAAGLARFLELDGWMDSRIENFSHGMKQKLVLISALVHDPPVLVIDEPMVGLDAFAQKQVKTLLRQQADAGKTVFLTTHTLSVAEAVSDRVIILHRGRIVAEGTPGELKQLHGVPGAPLEDLFLELTFPGETA
jgi:ABC-2 type transport system ATP-binding protein